MDEIKDIKESKIINFLIPEAINQNQNIHKEIRQRIRLNKIFNHFENKATNELNYFIEESNKRYNSLKNGHSLNSLIINSKIKSINKASKILMDPFFSSFDLEKEKEKMKIIKTEELNKNMVPLLSKIKQPETVDLKYFEEENRKNNNGVFQGQDDDEFNFNFIPKNTNKYKEYIENIIHSKKVVNKYWNRRSTIENKKRLIKFHKDAALLARGKNNISKWFKQENKLVNNTFDNYKKLLMKKGNSISGSISKKEILNNKLYLPNLKLLNFNLKNEKNKKNEKKNSPKNNIDIVYLSSFFEKQNISRNNKINKINTEEKKNGGTFPLLTEINNSQSYNLDNYKSTHDLVVNSAKKELYIEKDLDYKRKKLEKIFKVENAPKIVIYDEILKRKSESIKNERHKRAQKIIEHQDYIGGSKKDVLNYKIDNNVRLLDNVCKDLDKEFNNPKKNL